MLLPNYGGFYQQGLSKGIALFVNKNLYALKCDIFYFVDFKRACGVSSRAKGERKS